MSGVDEVNSDTWAIIINNKVRRVTSYNLRGGHNLAPELTEEGRGEGKGVEQGVMVHRLKYESM